MSAIQKLCQLNVTATSPTQGVRATATALDGIRVAIEPDTLATDDVTALAGQISLAIRGALKGMRRGEAEILRDAMSEVADGSAEHTALADALRRSRAEPPDVEAVVRSDAGNVKMRMDGYDSVELRIRPGSARAVAAGDLLREINHTVAATVREYVRRVQESQRQNLEETASNVR